MVGRRRIAKSVVLSLVVLAAAIFSGGCGKATPEGGLDAGGDKRDAATQPDSGPLSCTINADCAMRADGRHVCDVAGHACVECLTTVDCAGGRACMNKTCAMPKACNNSIDCPLDQVCDRASQTCVACVVDADCKTGERCVGNTCHPPCMSDQDCTPLGLLCNLTAGYCVSCVSADDCPQDRYCKDGQCAADVCKAGSSQCMNSATVTCNADGSGNSPPVACQANQSCREQGDSASCNNWICSPSVTGCQAGSEKVVLCSADGLSQTITDDCGATGQVCVSATCKPIVCQAGATYCVGAELRRCSAKGDSYTLTRTCTSAEYCDDPSDSCKPTICTPNQPACNVAVATTCNSNGSGFVAGGIDCASSGQICAQGVCKTLLCPPSTRYCDANTVRMCGADGLTSSLYQTCLTSEFCDPITPACRTQICTPNQPACNSSTATTCNSNGSGYVAGGVDCASTNQACVQGVCRDRVCTPSSLFCASNTVRQCSTDGATSTLYQTCTTAQFCDTGTNSCRAQICTPNQAACDGSVATTCNASGSGFTGGRTDCSLVGQSCSGGVCSTCPSGNGAIASVHLWELNVGSTDYLALKNTSTMCSANLAGLKLEMLDSDTTFFTLDFQLPSRTLAPGEVVYVFENSAPTTSDIGTGGNIGFAGSRGGWVVLCQAPCSLMIIPSPVDAIAFQGGAAPPLFPAPVTFTSALTSITSSNETTTSYIRTSIAGTPPSFVSTGWTTGAKTR